LLLLPLFFCASYSVIPPILQCLTFRPRLYLLFPHSLCSSYLSPTLPLSILPFFLILFLLGLKHVLVLVVPLFFLLLLGFSFLLFLLPSYSSSSSSFPLLLLSLLLLLLLSKNDYCSGRRWCSSRNCGVAIVT